METTAVRPYVRKANYYETDQMGIIHHSNYIRWFEEARVDLMEQIGFGYGQLMAHGLDFAVLGVSCDYKSMVRFGDTVHIKAEITALGAARMAVGYTVTDAATGAVRATGESRHCCYDGRKQRPVALKKALPELYALFCALCAGPAG